MRLNIVIPSYKRWHKLAGKDYFKTAQYVVPKSQKKEYCKVVGEKRVVAIPDRDDGNIARKRNWILRNIPRPLLMIDDDVKYLVMTEDIHQVRNKEHKTATEKIKLSWEQTEGIIINGFNLAYQWGCVLWGINLNTDGRNYQQYKPFTLTEVILGPFMGHLKHDLFYDERMGTKDDYDFSLQALNKHRKVLRFNKFAYECEHGYNKGGIVAMRTFQKEVGYCRAVERKWGRSIIKYPLHPRASKDLLNGRVSVPIAGV